MGELGYIAQIIALLVAAYSLMAYIFAIKQRSSAILQSAKGASGAMALLATVATGALVYQLITSDFSNAYVASHTDLALPLVYKITAFWAGQEGSLLLWGWILSVITAIVVNSRNPEGFDMIPFVGAILSVINIFFLAVLTLVSNPFATLTPIPADGLGLNPLLQNAGMIIHPPTQYLGYVGFAVPYAYAMTALLVRRADPAWIKITRRWTLFSWLMLSIGMIYGAQWAYVELGWGGYWAWDPVENASLLPWLTGTAFLHSVMIQEKKGMLKVWNISLITATFLLTLFGTYLTRSGILSSVHAFGNSTLGDIFLWFMTSVLLASLYLGLNRSEVLASEHRLQSTLSRESSFLANNLLLVISAFTIFWGTLFPIISELVRGVKVSVGAPYFNAVNLPIGILLVILMGMCPLIAWKRSSSRNLRINFLYPFAATVLVAIGLYASGIRHMMALMAFASSFFVIATTAYEFIRGVSARMRIAEENLLLASVRLLTHNRRRWGGYMVHIGVVLMVMSMAGSGAYTQEVTKSVARGEELVIGDYQMSYNGLYETPKSKGSVVYADLAVSKKGNQLGILKPEKVFHDDDENSHTNVSILGGLKEDFYVILAGWSENGDKATFKVLVSPLMAWMWLGEYLLAFGTLFAMWPQRRRLDIDLGQNQARSV